MQRAAGGGIHGRGIRGVAGVDLRRLAVELAEGDSGLPIFSRAARAQETLAEGQHGAGSGEFAGRLGSENRRSQSPGFSNFTRVRSLSPPREA